MSPQSPFQPHIKLFTHSGERSRRAALRANTLDYEFSLITLLRYHPSVVNTINKTNGESFLQYAVRQVGLGLHPPMIIDILLSSPARIGLIQDNSKNTAFSVAVNRDSRDAVTRLLTALLQGRMSTSPYALRGFSNVFPELAEKFPDLFLLQV